MSKTTSDFTVPYRKGAMIKTVLAGLGLATMIVGFAWLNHYNPHKTWKVYLILAFCPTALFACLVLIYGALRTLLRRSPALTVNQTGILHDSSVGETIHIPWSKIAGFQLREQPGQHDATALWIDVLPQGASLKPVLSLHANHLAASPEQVLNDLKQYRANHTFLIEEPTQEKQPFRFTYRFGVSVGFVFFFLLGIALTALPHLQSLSQQTGSYESYRD